MLKPKVYLASKFQRGLMWREFLKDLEPFEIVSTWFNGPNVGLADSEPPETQLDNWTNDRRQVLSSDLLIAYGTRGDLLNGTMIEIGMAYGKGIPIYLAGSYPWATWTALPNVHTFAYLTGAIGQAKKDFKLDQT